MKQDWLVKVAIEVVDIAGKSYLGSGSVVNHDSVGALALGVGRRLSEKLLNGVEVKDIHPAVMVSVGVGVGLGKEGEGVEEDEEEQREKYEGNSFVVHICL